MEFEIRRYRTATDEEPFTQWLSELSDRQARARILAQDIPKAVELWQEYQERKKRAPRGKI